MSVYGNKKISNLYAQHCVIEIGWRFRDFGNSIILDW